MTIIQVIEDKYDDLLKYCNKNIINRSEIHSSRIIDIEDVDILHSMIIIWLKKYKKCKFKDKEEIYNQLRTEFLGEIKYSKLYKPNSLQFIQITNFSIKDDNSDNP